jgi:hypothetical protein
MIGTDISRTASSPGPAAEGPSLSSVCATPEIIDTRPGRLKDRHDHAADGLATRRANPSRPVASGAVARAERHGEAVHR